MEGAEALDGDVIDEVLSWVLDKLEEEAKDDGFLAERVESQVARMCEMFELPIPANEATAADEPTDIS